MLVLGRREGQHIVIGERIVVTVVRARGNQIRLGIEAPKDVPIRRSELEGSGSKTLLAAGGGSPLGLTCLRAGPVPGRPHAAPN